MLDYHSEESFPHLLESLHNFKGGLAYYRERQWDKAIDCFAEASFANPDDPLPRMYVDRCMQFKTNPPGETWKGVWILESK